MIDSADGRELDGAEELADGSLTLVVSRGVGIDCLRCVPVRLQCMSISLLSGCCGPHLRLELELRNFGDLHRLARLWEVYGIAMQLRKSQAVVVEYVHLALIRDDQPVDGDNAQDL